MVVINETQFDARDYSYSTPKVKTGILGLDDVLNGGIPEGSLTLVSGGPGSGKTILGLDLSFEGRLPVRPEFCSRLRSGSRILEVMGISGDFDLRGMLGILRQQAEEKNAKRIMMDAPDVFSSSA